MCNHLLSQKKYSTFPTTVSHLSRMIWMRCNSFFFFQRHLTPAMHLYLFQMKSEMLSLSLPCHGCDAWDGIYNHKVRPPLGFSEHHC